MKNLFNSVRLTRPKTNVFDLSHDVKLSCNMGQLVPIMCTEAVPGDKFHLSCEALVRFAPLVAPVMHRMDVTMHYFFVPNRILWDGWEDFITGAGTPDFPTWQIQGGVLADYSPLLDYLGVPDNAGMLNDLTISALPMAAYQAIYNEYYRDENLVAEVDYKLIDGLNNANTALKQLRKRAWEHDYFTSALPFAQKGGAVDLPIAGFEDVPVRVNQDHPGAPLAAILDNTAGADVDVNGDQSSVPFDGDGLIAKTSLMQIAATTINDLRRAFKLQEWLERAARGGTRYAESILSQFGVKSSDKRLQRPEYITGSKSPVVISEVLNTSDTATAPQGEMAGHGISVTSGNYGQYFCEEHGYIIGIMSVMPKPAYQQGCPKHFLKIMDPFQYYWPSFANLGEQPIEVQELYAYQASSFDTFGYVPRYAEYKFQHNRVAGEFKTSLDFWHMGRIFSSVPALNQAFIEVDSATTDRAFAVTAPTVQKLYCQIYNKVKAVRPMPVFGTPTL